MLNLLIMIAAFALPATSPAASQPADAIPFWHMIVTADDEGVMVRGLVELSPGRESAPVVLEFPDAVDLEAGLQPESASVRFDGSRVEISQPSGKPARLDFQYWLPWPEKTDAPLTISLAQPRPIRMAMVSLPMTGVRFETRGLEKTEFDAHAVYIAEDLAPKNDAAVMIYPPRPWWGRSATENVLIASLVPAVVFLLLKGLMRKNG